MVKIDAAETFSPMGQAPKILDAKFFITQHNPFYKKNVKPQVQDNYNVDIFSYTVFTG